MQRRSGATVVRWGEDEDELVVEKGSERPREKKNEPYEAGEELRFHGLRPQLQRRSLRESRRSQR